GPDATPDALALEDIRYLLASQHPGLNLPPFVAVAHSLAAYEQAALMSGPEAAEQAAAHLDALAQALAAMRENPIGPPFEDAATAVRWLALRGQAPQLVESVRYHYGKPNFFLHMSE